MKTLITLFLLCAGVLCAQQPVSLYYGAPSLGTACSPAPSAPNAFVTPAGTLLTCQNGKWVQSALPIACAGTPGSTAGQYRQLCETSGGALYICNNSAGCTVAGDWVQTPPVDGLTICEVSGAITTCTATGTISAAAVLTLHSVPVQAVAAIANDVIVVDSATLWYVYNTAVYSFSGTIAVDVNATAVTGTCASGLITASANRICQVIPVAIAPVVDTTYIDQPVNIVASADPTTTGGLGTISYWIKYRILIGL